MKKIFLITLFVILSTNAYSQVTEIMQLDEPFTVIDFSQFNTGIISFEDINNQVPSLLTLIEPTGISCDNDTCNGCTDNSLGIRLDNTLVITGSDDDPNFYNAVSLGFEFTGTISQFGIALCDSFSTFTTIDLFNNQVQVGSIDFFDPSDSCNGTINPILINSVIPFDRVEINKDSDCSSIRAIFIGDLATINPAPTMSQWGMIAFGFIAGLFGLWFIRKKKAVSV